MSLKIVVDNSIIVDHLQNVARASQGLQPMDAVIAATAAENGVALFTLNQRHFRFIEGLVVVNP